MSQSLSSLIKSTFGFATRIQESNPVVTVAVTATRICNSNNNRLGLTIVNSGTANIWLSTLKEIVVGQGIFLAAAGGSISFKWDQDFALIGNDFYAIGDGGASTVHIVEVIATGSGKE